MKKKLQTMVDESLYKEVLEYCRKYGISQGEFLRQAVIEKLEKKKEAVHQ